MDVNYTQLIEDCRRRDRRAMRQLYDLTAPMAMGVCMRYSHDRDTAQDLMQEGYIKVYEGLKKLKEPERLMAWVYRVMVNVCINYCRRVSPLEYLEDVKLEPAVFPADPFGSEEVVMTLQQLPERHRAVFNMLEIEGFSEEEVAEKLKTPVSNVRTIMSRAKKMMRERLTK